VREDLRKKRKKTWYQRIRSRIVLVLGLAGRGVILKESTGDASGRGDVRGKAILNGKKMSVDECLIKGQFRESMTINQKREGNRIEDRRFLVSFEKFRQYGRKYLG